MNNTEFFYNGFNDNNDEYSDPFAPVRKPVKEAAVPVKGKKYEKFEIVTNRNLQTIVSVIALVFFYYKSFSRVYYEFLRESASSLRLLTYISSVFLIISMIPIIYYIIMAFVKAVKHKENISPRNTFIAAGVALMTDIAYIIFAKRGVPDIVLTVIIAVIILAATIILMVRESEKEDRGSALFVIITLLALFIHMITFSVFFSVVYRSGSDYTVKMVCIQSGAAEKNEKDLVIVKNSLMNQTNDYAMYYSTEAALPDKVFRSAKELDSYYAEAEKLRISNGASGGKYDEAAHAMEAVLSPELSKYDDNFFISNDLVVVSFSLYKNIENASLPEVYTKESTDLTYLHFCTEDTSGSGNTDEHGICYALISVPKEKSDIFSNTTRCI